MSVQEVRLAKRNLLKSCRSISQFVDNGFDGEKPLTVVQTVEHWMDNLGKETEKIMVAAKAKKANANDKKEFKGFVNYLLSVDDKNAFKEWEVDAADLLLLVAGDVSEGYKMGVSYNPQNSTFVATYMCNSDDSPNAGYMLSAFAPDWFNAVKSLVFKHQHVLGCIWPVGKAAERDSWG